MPPYSPIQPWINRTDPFRGFANIDIKQPNQEFGGFIGLDVSVPLHQAADLPAQSLNASWEKTDIYVRRSLEIIDLEQPYWLDRDEARIIVSELGPPPVGCYPVYIVSVGAGQNERAVYVGKTSAKVRRFQSGHRVTTKLHAPKYHGMPKQIYLGCVTLLSNEKDYLPLEWVHPIASAKAILNSVERQLIYNLQTELNIQHRKTYNPTVPIRLEIENHSGSSRFLHGHSVPT